MKDKLIKWLGGYTEDEVLGKAVKNLYNTINEDDIIREEQGEWFVGDKPIQEGMKKHLSSEATTMMNMRIWKYLQNDIKYQANKRMFEQSRTAEDLIAGKLWLLTLDSINTRLKSLSKGSGRFNSDAR